MPSTSELVDDEKHIADVDANVAADVGVVNEVTHCAFPAAVEVEAEELAFGIQIGLPELPPVVCTLAVKATCMVPSLSA